MGPSDHEHYGHYDAAMAKRLDRAWGHVDGQINRRIAALVENGERVLDLGCGFGSLAGRLSTEHRVVGIDPLLYCLDVARHRYPGTTAICGSATDLPLGNGTVDVAVLRDVLHHLVDETSVNRVFAELDRVGVRRVIVVDPNPNLLLLAARRIIHLRDPVCGPAAAVDYLEAGGFRAERTEYSVLYSLPLSGGYVGPVLLPRWRVLWAPLLWLEEVFCNLLGRLGLGRLVCWRYTIVASRVSRS